MKFARPVFKLPVAPNVPVEGLYSTAVARPYCSRFLPPAWPLFSTVAGKKVRWAPMLPVKDQVCACPFKLAQRNNATRHSHTETLAFLTELSFLSGPNPTAQLQAVARDCGFVDQGAGILARRVGAPVAASFIAQTVNANVSWRSSICKEFAGGREGRRRFDRHRIVLLGVRLLGVRTAGGLCERQSGHTPPFRKLSRAERRLLK